MPAPRAHAGARRPPVAAAQTGTRIGMIFLALMIVPLVQIGYTYWLSAGLVCVLLGLWAARDRIAAGVWPGRAIMPVLMLMYVPLAYSQSADIPDDVLRISREAVLLAIMYFASVASAASSRIEPMRLREFRRIELTALAIVILLLVLAVVQVFFLARGRYFGLPQPWFVINGGALPSELDLKYSALRPSGTFGEPSYLGFIVLSIMVMLSPMILKSRRTMIVLVACLVCGLISRSASFLLGSLVILFAAVATGGHDERERVTRTLLGIMAIAVAVVAASYLGLLSRFTGSGGVDSSTQLRIFTPLRILPDYLWDHPFGLPVSQLMGELRYYVLSFLDPLPVDNALANLFFQYGIGTAFLIVAMIIAVQRTWVLRAYVVCSMMFNGGFLTIDKCAMFLIVLVVYEAASRYAVQSSAGVRPPLSPRDRRMPTRPVAVER
jgi:hypothetical protein